MAKRKRLVQGKDFHGWAWKHKKMHKYDPMETCLFHWAEPYRPKRAKADEPTESGGWVKVKFVEVA